MTNETSGISRRTLAKGAAWAVPAVAVAAATPAMAASPKPCVGAVCVTLTGDACKHPGNPKWYHFGVTIKNSSTTDTFTVQFASMNVNGEIKTPTSSPGGLSPSSTTIGPNTTLSVIIDAGLYSNSANGVATLTFSVGGVQGSATTNVNDLPPCGTGSGSAWAQAQPKDDPPHTAGKMAAEKQAAADAQAKADADQADAQAKADADQAAADAQAKTDADQAAADAQAKTDADQAAAAAETNE